VGPPRLGAKRFVSVTESAAGIPTREKSIGIVNRTPVRGSVATRIAAPQGYRKTVQRGLPDLIFVSSGRVMSKQRQRDARRADVPRGYRRCVVSAVRLTAAVLMLLAGPWVGCLAAQQPFSTDDADVTARGMTHVEVFEEYDSLQPSQYPHLRQNTFNMRVNYGLTDQLELDLDAPLITIFNASPTTPPRPFGLGDTNFGMKYNVREDHHGANGVAVALVTYVEVPTGDVSSSLGSGATDVWVYTAIEKALTDRTTLRLNGGYLFVGNTSTGVVGITTTTHGHIATMGGSLVRTMTDKLQLGAEITAAATHGDLNRGQLQFVAGASYELRKGFSLDAGFIVGHFAASPREGIQLGISLDLPRR
jgi:hypothetical protein